ncbi:MAG TPA: adhesin [Pseudonocardiaceae bacterium]
MLTVSEAAAEAIKSLVSDNQMPEGSGLRIYRHGSAESTKSEGLELSIAAKPADDDEVVEDKGARVFLPPNVVNVMLNMELNAERVNENGEESFNFTVDPRKGTEIRRKPPGFPGVEPE